MRFIISVAVIFSLAAIVFLEQSNKSSRSVYDQKLATKFDLAKQQLELQPDIKVDGYVHYLLQDVRLSHNAMRQSITQHSSQLSAENSSLVWSDNLGNSVNITALGVDRQYYFANSYLRGIRPFAVDNAWLPLYALAKRKVYQYDHEQYDGAPEIWQNSKQAFIAPRGDCEDHAIVLADWLISEGIDARVVLGKYKKGGHAWVVAIKDGKAYVLEATDKRVRKSWNHYPLASLARDYHPQYMFNRQFFWVNKGSDKTTDYSEKRWLKTSQYVAM